MHDDEGVSRPRGREVAQRTLFCPIPPSLSFHSLEGRFLIDVDGGSRWKIKIFIDLHGILNVQICPSSDLFLSSGVKTGLKTSHYQRGHWRCLNGHAFHYNSGKDSLRLLGCTAAAGEHDIRSLLRVKGGFGGPASRSVYEALVVW